MADDSIIKDSFEYLKSLLSAINLPVTKIILFGSYANGKNQIDSDIDYIVVSSMFRDKNIFEKFDLTKGIKAGLVNKFIQPFDILYYSDIEWETSRAIAINEAKKYGVVLYSS
jgi:predicted nucleotidyltransferase